jgi:hypothetical protein
MHDWALASPSRVVAASAAGDGVGSLSSRVCSFVATNSDAPVSGPSQSTYAPPPHAQPHNIQVDAPTSQPREAARLLGTLISLSEREYSKMQVRAEVPGRHRVW